MIREELFREKCSGSKVQEEIALEGVSWGVNSPGVMVQEGNYSGVIIQRAKVRRVIFLGKLL